MKNFILILLLLSVLWSCKKKDTSPVAAGNQKSDTLIHKGDQMTIKITPAAMDNPISGYSLNVGCNIDPSYDVIYYNGMADSSTVSYDPSHKLFNIFTNNVVTIIRDEYKAQGPIGKFTDEIQFGADNSQEIPFDTIEVWWKGAHVKLTGIEFNRGASLDNADVYAGWDSLYMEPLELTNGQVGTKKYW